MITKVLVVEKQFAIKMTNGSGERCTFKHLESGLTRLESEGNCEVTVGEKSGEGPTIVINTPNGDVDICVRDGHICLKATDITLDATDSIVMNASKIKIGEGNPTSQITIAAQRVEVLLAREIYQRYYYQILFLLLSVVHLLLIY